MSNSYNNTTKENINFIEKPVISIDNFSVEGNSSFTIEKQIINRDCEYIKLVCGLDIEDETLTTDFYGAVCIDYIINCRDDKGHNKKSVDGFYPKYKHENNNGSDSTIIASPGKIESIEVNITNNEDISVNISDFKVFVSETTNMSPESIGNGLSEYYNNGGQTTLVIPLVNELPDINSVPDGYICRLSTIG